MSFPETRTSAQTTFDQPMDPAWKGSGLEEGAWKLVIRRSDKLHAFFLLILPKVCPLPIATQPPSPPKPGQHSHWQE